MYRMYVQTRQPDQRPFAILNCSSNDPGGCTATAGTESDILNKQTVTQASTQNIIQKCYCGQSDQSHLATWTTVTRVFSFKI